MIDTKTVQGERNLWSAMILQALEDLFCFDDKEKQKLQSLRAEHEITKSTRTLGNIRKLEASGNDAESARRFLTWPGAHKAHRDFICDMIDIDGDVLRESVIKNRLRIKQTIGA